jgi:hypothetical protein
MLLWFPLSTLINRIASLRSLSLWLPKGLVKERLKTCWHSHPEGENGFEVFEDKGRNTFFPPVQVATEKMRYTEMSTARTMILSLAVECRSLSSETMSK